MTLRVVTWNMNHRVKVKKHAWDFLRYEIAPDIAVVQEAHPPDDLRASERFIYPRKIWGRIGASGIWSRSFPIRKVKVMTSVRDALIAAVITLPNWQNPLLAISMYAKWGSDNHVTPNLHRMISDLHPLFIDKSYRGRIILAGDWNIDTRYNENYRAPLHRLVFERLEDPYYGLQRCNKAPLRTIMHGSKFSYQDDYIYVGRSLILRQESCEVITDPAVKTFSDHLPVLAVFKV